MLKNMKLAPKLIASFVLVALIVVVVGIIGLNSIKNIATMSDIILDEEVPVADATMEMTIALISGRDVMGEYLLSTDINRLDAIKQEYLQTVADYDKFAGAILNGAKEEGWTVIATDNEKLSKLITEADAYHTKFQEASAEMMKFHKQALQETKRELSNADALAYGFMEQIDEFSSKANELQIQAETLAGEEMDRAMNNADDAQANGTNLMIVFSIVGFVLAVIIGYFLSRLVSKPLQVITNASQEIALGDLNQEIHIDQKDEIGQLATAFKQMLEGLKAKTNVASEIARGNVDVEVNIASEKDALGKAMNEMKNSIAALIREGKALAKAGEEGRLDVRGDTAKFQGGFREVLEGMNNIIENILKPVNEAVGCLAEMAKGDLTVSVTGNYQGDHAIMKESLNSTLAALNDILGQVAVATEQIASGSQQVSDSSQSLSQGATEQASSLEEVTSSMTEMGSQTKQNADNATQANQLASSARENAETGNEQMQAMLGAMGEINESSGQISKIIKVIDEIAFQTNLLALNAAVEAARAGVHGKGFAVVAEEVRNLAQRSAKAAKETTELIEGSVKKAENGGNIANATAKALEEIMSGITKVTDLVGEIASASNEQAQGIGQISEALGQIDQVTQSNTASAEESAAASEELSGQAVQLKGMLSKFTLVNSGNSQNRGPALSTSRKSSPQSKETWGEKDSSHRNNSPVSQAAVILDDGDFGKF